MNPFPSLKDNNFVYKHLSSLSSKCDKKILELQYCDQRFSNKCYHARQPSNTRQRKYDIKAHIHILQVLSKRATTEEHIKSMHKDY